MKREIEAALQPLRGEPLADMWRYGCQVFEFGEPHPALNRKGRQIILHDWKLVVTCGWRIIGPEGIIVSSKEFGPGLERRDEGAVPFYELLGQQPPYVEDIQADVLGGIVLHLTRGYAVEVLPENPDDTGELWRFGQMQADSGLPTDFVVTVNGIEEPVEENDSP